MLSVSGLDAVVLDISHAGAEIKSKARAITEAKINDVANTAKSLVPQDTGATGDSISSDVVESAGMVIGEAGPSTRYAQFIEYGTYKDAPQAFMGPALDRHSGDYQEQLGDAAAI